MPEAAQNSLTDYRGWRGSRIRRRTYAKFNPDVFHGSSFFLPNCWRWPTVPGIAPDSPERHSSRTAFHFQELAWNKWQRLKQLARELGLPPRRCGLWFKKYTKTPLAYAFWDLLKVCIERSAEECNRGRFRFFPDGVFDYLSKQQERFDRFLKFPGRIDELNW